MPDLVTPKSGIVPDFFFISFGRRTLLVSLCFKKVKKKHKTPLQLFLVSHLELVEVRLGLSFAPCLVDFGGLRPHYVGFLSILYTVPEGTVFLTRACRSRGGSPSE